MIILADGTKLVLGFKNEYDDDIFFSFPYAKPSATISNIKNLMNVIIANGDIFKDRPVSMLSAKTITTTETAYDLSY